MADTSSKIVDEFGKISEDPYRSLLIALHEANKLQVQANALRETEIKLLKKQLNANKNDIDKVFYSRNDICTLLKKDSRVVVDLIKNDVLPCRSDVDAGPSTRYIILKDEFDDFMKRIQAPEYPENFSEKAQKYIRKTGFYLKIQ